MQLKIVAAAVAAMLSGAAGAVVSVGGKVDVGYQFRQEAKDASIGGGVTTESLTDGSSSTSRITFVEKEDLGNGMSIEVNMDLRFSGGYEQGTTGLTSSDKRVLVLRTSYVNFAWGVQNIDGIAGKSLADKPYMVSPKDMELVKFGISGARESSLTSRNTQIFTNPISVGDLNVMLYANHAFGDNRTKGANDVSGQHSGDLRVAGFEFKLGPVNGGNDWSQKVSTNDAAATRNGIIFTHSFVTYRVTSSLRLSSNFNTYRGYDGAGSAFFDKNTNFVISYNLGNKLEIGAEASHLNDMGSASRNSGKGWMVGAAYFITKNTWVYMGVSRTNYERNQATVNGKFDGTSKLDGRLTRIGMVKEF
jgi:Gram-negative porin